MAANDYEKSLVREVLRAIPIGSLVHIEYEPASGVRPEVSAAARVLGMSPTTYIVEMTGVGENDKKEPLFYGKVLNRGGEHRTFAPFRGKLTKIDILRLGPRT